jgi:hypothetical protein
MKTRLRETQTKILRLAEQEGVDTSIPGQATQTHAAAMTEHRE